MDEAKEVEDIVPEEGVVPESAAPPPEVKAQQPAAAPAQAESKPNKDRIYSFNATALEAVRNAKPWTTE